MISDNPMSFIISHMIWEISIILEEIFSIRLYLKISSLPWRTKRSNMIFDDCSILASKSLLT